METAAVWALRLAGLWLLEAAEWELRGAAREVYQATQGAVTLLGHPKNPE